MFTKIKNMISYCFVKIGKVKNWCLDKEDAIKKFGSDVNIFEVVTSYSSTRSLKIKYKKL